MTENSSKTADASSVKPQSVRLAVIGMLAVAGAGLVHGVNGLLESAAYASGLDEASKTVNRQQIIDVTGNLRGSVVLISVLGIATVVLLVPLAALVNRRLRWARVTTAVVAGVLIIGEIVLLASDSSSVQTGNFIRDSFVPGGDLATVEAMNRLIVPSWFVPIHYLTEFAILAGLIFVLVQLFRTTTNEYFQDGHETVAHAENTWAIAQVRKDV